MTDNLRWVMVLLLSSLSCYIWAAVSAFFATRPDSLTALRERMTARMNARITRLPPQFRGWLDERRKTPDAVWFNVTTLRLAAIVLAILATGELGVAVWIRVHR